MKVKYIGGTFGIDSLTNGKIYKVVGIEYDMLRVIDDSGEDYLYSAKNPGTIAGDFIGGVFKIVEDDENKSLDKVINKGIVFDIDE